MPTRTSLSLLAASLLPGVAAASDASSPDLGGSLLQLVSGLLLVIALLFASLWLLKKISLTRGVTGGLVRVVSAAAVGTRERVVVVDVGTKRLILGVAPGRVALLDEQPIPESAPTASATNDPVAVPEFALWLKRTIAKRNEK